MDSERKAIIERIKKLFALADNNPNANEALAAALKAQKLIANYDIGQSELSHDEEEPIVEIEALVRERAWGVALANIVASNFRCKTFTRVGNHKKIPVFLGYEMDSKAAALTYTYLYRAGDRGAKKICREFRKRYGTAKGLYNDYAMGFLHGVKCELEKQSQVLMIMTPTKVIKAFDAIEFDKGVSRFHALKKGVSVDDVFNKGERDGHDAIRSKRLEKRG